MKRRKSSRKTHSIPPLQFSPKVARFIFSGIFGLMSIILTLSFTQSEGIPSFFNNYVRDLVGIFVFTIPLLLLQLSLFILGIKKLIVSRTYVVIGSQLTIISLIGITKSGLWGLGLFSILSNYLTSIGTYFLLLIFIFLGVVIAFNISTDQISFFLIKLLHKIRNKYEVKNINELSEAQSEEESSPLPAREVSMINKPITPKTLPNQLNIDQEPLEVDDDQYSTSTQLVLHKPWILPPTSLLISTSNKAQSQSRIKQQAQTIIDTLSNAGIDVELGERPHIGPAVTQFALKLNDSNKLTKISNMSQILAYALAAPTGQIRIEAPIPGKTLVGIEVPNDQIEIVSLRTILESGNMRDNTSPTLIALGKDLSGESVSYELAKMPHLLIAGTTGSGKSICVHSIIQSILFRTPPTQVRMILIDPKRVELNNYAEIPYLLTPVITEIKKVLPALKWCVQEMYDRLKILEQDGSKNIAEYNRKHPDSQLPYILVVVDELNDIMMQSPKEGEEMIVKLAQMARAPGIHLILATQRPDVNVITGLIKANIPARIAFALPQMQDSRTIIDQPGAEKLLGRGDMLFLAPDKGKPYRIQGAFVSTEEVNKVVEFIRTQQVPSQYINFDSKNTSLDSDEESSDSQSVDDPKFRKALEIFLNSNAASVSLLQTEMNIGYNKASRIFSQSLKKGFVTEAQTSKGRKEINVGLIKEYLYGNSSNH